LLKGLKPNSHFLYGKTYDRCFLGRTVPLCHFLLTYLETARAVNGSFSIDDG
jgi:hypothetical protein